MSTLSESNNHTVAHPALRLVEHPIPDLAAAEQAAAAFLEALGRAIESTAVFGNQD